MKKNVHVLPKGKTWGVKIAGNEKLSKTFETQKDAIEYGRKRAIENESELLIHNRQGEIREKNSYGNDNYPPKG